MLKRIITVLLTLILASLFYFIIKIDLLPTLYLVLLVSIIIVVYLVSLYMLFKNSKVLNIISYILIGILAISSLFSIYFIYKTDNFIDKTFNNKKIEYTNIFLLVSNKEQEIENKRYGYFLETPNIEEAIKNIKYRKLNDYKDIDIMLKDLDKNIDIILIEKEMYNTFLKDKNLVILKEFDITIIDEYKTTDNNISNQSEYIDNKDNINIYVGGTDFTNTLYDFNMIISINKKTKNILLTSIPRDYYITIPRFNRKDNMGYIGAWGINESKNALEQLFNIKINYYVKINTSSLVGVVDSLNGVSFCSNIEFLTTHAKLTDSYDDSKGEKLYVKKGCYNYSGVEILTIARERYAYKDGDRQRQKNCQQIMIAIFNKIFSITNLTNYDRILNNLSNLYSSNIPRDVITDLVKDHISNNNWKIKTQSVTGYDSRGTVHLTNYQDYVMIPDMNSVYQAKEKIKNN